MEMECSTISVKHIKFNFNLARIKVEGPQCYHTFKSIAREIENSSKCIHFLKQRLVWLIKEI